MLAGIKTLSEPGWFATGGGANVGTDSAPHRLDVLAADLADAVCLAGGWLFDHAVLGWDVVAILACAGDPRHLRILGVDVVDLQPVPRVGAQAHKYLPQPPKFCNPIPNSGNVSSEGSGTTARGSIWGDQASIGLNDACFAQHQLSDAAYALKQHAVRPADVAPRAPSSTETSGAWRLHHRPLSKCRQSGDPGAAVDRAAHI